MVFGKPDGEEGKQILDKWEMALDCGPVQRRPVIIRGNSVEAHGREDA